MALLSTVERRPAAALVPAAPRLPNRAALLLGLALTTAVPAAPMAPMVPVAPTAGGPGPGPSGSSAGPAGADAAADPAPPPAAAAPQAPAAPPVTQLIDRETLDALVAGKRIGTIHIISKNIFDPTVPGENRGIFRLANRLHHPTRRQVIENQLLFKPGDPYSPEAVRETERILRNNRYFYDVQIRPVDEDAQKVDLEVVTRDVWTLQAGINYHRAGGTSSTEFDVEDENFFGTGKDIEVARQSNIDRTQDFVRYRDPTVNGTHALLDATFASASDGDTRELILDRPFYSLDTRWAVGGSFLHNVQIDPLYDGGDITDRFRQRHDLFDIYGGLSPGLSDGVTQRFRAGYTYDRSLFSEAPFYPPPDAAAADRRLSYPWVSYELIQDGFVTLHNFDRIHRTEDFNFGLDVMAQLGWSSPLFGGDRSRMIFNSTWSDGWAISPHQMLLLSGGLGGRLSEGRIENGVVTSSFRWYHRTFGNGLLVVRFSGDMAENLDLENQLLLGGDNGLRGYPLRYQLGDRRFLATVEQRFYGEKEYFHLVHLGAAAFFDTGRAWFVEPPPSGVLLAGVPRGMLKDVGAGLRLGSSRSAQGALIHLDAAFPLDRVRSIKAVQFLVTTSETF